MQDSLAEITLGFLLVAGCHSMFHLLFLLPPVVDPFLWIILQIFHNFVCVPVQICKIAVIVVKNDVFGIIVLLAKMNKNWHHLDQKQVKMKVMLPWINS